ncbi:MAG: hypothetical protein JXQ83_00185, partial [Candidatus Glassbacteria bacterium]|nr:hypothetical protein [Candidatus Glassbacteria bacterium]
MQATRKSVVKMGSLGLVFALVIAGAVYLYSQEREAGGSAGASPDTDSTASAVKDSSAGDQKAASAVPVEVSAVFRGDVHDYILQNATVDTEE